MDLEAKLAKIGLDEPKIKEILKNQKVAETFGDVAEESGFAPKAALLHSLALAARSATPEKKKGRAMVARAIADGRLASSQQVLAAWNYVNVASDPNDSDLDREAGVGVHISAEEVEQTVRMHVEEHKSEIESQRYKALPKILGNVKRLESMRWASPCLFKPAIDKAFLELLGPKDERDDPKVTAKSVKAKDNIGPAFKGKKEAESCGQSERLIFREGFLASLHKPGENLQTRPELMEEHLKATGGRVFTRFPPEPNGYLHIGHAKAIATNFGFASFHNGECYLRFDDTNPEAEDERYSKSIEEIVEWLGFKPYKVTWSSDYFDKLYELAEKLITKGHAYVCFCTPEEVKRSRGIKEDGTPGGIRTACVHRSQLVEETMMLFRAMRSGEYAKGTATLRMRMDLENPNPQMWDLVAYRVLDAPHHRTGSKWKIYPTYDFTHCLVDSIENISHSLCTLEFRLSRESYEWLCDAVDVYKPAQREFGRLNLTGAVMSKRKILQLVEKGYVSGWDDPRLYTIVALRRRGIPPGAILAFVAELGVTTATTTTEIIRFEASVRKYLENTVPRLMMILDPVKVVIDNLPHDYHLPIMLPYKPGSPEMGEHVVQFTNVVYIDRSDFREKASDNYFRLAPGKTVGLLKVPFPITATSFEKDAEGVVTVIHARYEDNGATKKPKAFIQWVAESPQHGSPVKLAEVREFESLFKSDNPSSNPAGFLDDLNPNSQKVYTTAIIETGFDEVRKNSPWRPRHASGEGSILEGNDKIGAPESVRFQALRLGYYCMDRDSKSGSIVLNRIVTLKEDKNK